VDWVYRKKWMFCSRQRSGGRWIRYMCLMNGSEGIWSSLLLLRAAYMDIVVDAHSGSVLRVCLLKGSWIREGELRSEAGRK
jgi:hypothetical protein